MAELSKSKYCALWQCPKIAWLKKHKPEEEVTDESVRSRMEAGSQVGALARGLFGEYADVTVLENGKISPGKMIRKTCEEMAKGTPVICEASFACNGLYCAVDILKKEGNGWAIYEVKSSSAHSDSGDDKQVYIADIAYQKYILEHCGIAVKGSYLVQINGDYTLCGDLDPNQFFLIKDLAREVALESKKIEANLSLAEEILKEDAEPEIDLSEACRDPYPCSFWPYCAKDLPKPSVFDLYRMNFKKKLSYYRKGMPDFPSLLQSGEIANEKQLRQINFALKDIGSYVDKAGIRKFLSQLSYPLYFLDFETMQPAIPLFEGTRPYQQIPFQYSLHYIEQKGGEVLHREFLAESGQDPRRALAERLCADIPMNVCVTAYNKAFECGRIRELAAAFPDLSEHLLNIRDHIVDLLIPFQSGYYYNRAMGGSFSIKSVLPALFPDDPSLNYHNLEGVHNGGEAMTLFPKIKDLPPEEQQIARKNLLKYCELDTYAMVKVWEELVRAAE